MNVIENAIKTFRSLVLKLQLLSNKHNKNDGRYAGIRTYNFDSMFDLRSDLTILLHISLKLSVGSGYDDMLIRNISYGEFLTANFSTYVSIRSCYCNVLDTNIGKYDEYFAKNPVIFADISTMISLKCNIEELFVRIKRITGDKITTLELFLVVKFPHLYFNTKIIDKIPITFINKKYKIGIIVSLTNKEFINIDYLSLSQNHLRTYLLRQMYILHKYKYHSIVVINCDYFDHKVNFTTRDNYNQVCRFIEDSIEHLYKKILLKPIKHPYYQILQTHSINRDLLNNLDNDVKKMFTDEKYILKYKNNLTEKEQLLYNNKRLICKKQQEEIHDVLNVIHTKM